jgi:hypothetical protein
MRNTTRNRIGPTFVLISFLGCGQPDEPDLGVAKVAALGEPPAAFVSISEDELGPHARSQLVSIRKDPRFREIRVARARIGRLLQEPELRFDLGGQARYANRTASVVVPGGPLRRTYQLTGNAGDARFVIHDRWVTGTVDVGKLRTDVIALGDGVVALAELREEAVALDDQPGSLYHGGDDPPPVTDESAVIRVLLVHSPALGGMVQDILGTAELWVADMNTALALSLVPNVRVELAHVQQVLYDEDAWHMSCYGPALPGQTEPPLLNDCYNLHMRDGREGMEDVPLYRDAYLADVVGYIETKVAAPNHPGECRDDHDCSIPYSCGGSVCGEALDIKASPEDAFFSINWVIGSLGFAHELGHIIGGRHENDTTADVSPPYSYGYVYETSTLAFATIMANGGFDGVRLKRYSTPDVVYEGAPIGTAERSDVARLIRERGPIVANFRPDQGTAVVPPTLYNTPQQCDGWNELSWSEVPNATHYEVYRTTTNSPSTPVQIATRTDRDMRVQVTSGSPHHYWVKACSVTACSATSNDVVARSYAGCE